MTDKIITYKGIQVEQSITLDDAPVNTDVPFVFKGVNTNTHTMLIRPIPTCGCTAMGNEITVEAGQEFRIEGHYKKSHKVGAFTKNVHIYFGTPTEGTNSEDRKITVNFSGRLHK